MSWRLSRFCLLCLLPTLLACAQRAPRTAQQPATPESYQGITSYLYSRMQSYQGDVPKAIVSLQKSLKADPDNLYLKTELAGLYAEEGKFEEARGILKEVFDVDPNYESALLLSGRIAAREGDLDTAAGDFRKILQADPDNNEVRMMLAEVYVARKQYQEALRELRIVERRDPEFLNAYYFEGLIYAVHLSDYSRAIQAYKKILVYEPNYLPAPHSAICPCGCGSSAEDCVTLLQGEEI